MPKIYFPAKLNALLKNTSNVFYYRLKDENMRQLPELIKMKR